MAHWGDLPPITIDPDSEMPRYLQLAQTLEGYIREGTLKAHSKLPSEHELDELLGLSRSTIRKALDELGRQMLVYRKQGQGTFVAGPRENALPPQVAREPIQGPRSSVGLQKNTAGIIGLLLPTMLNEIYPQIVKGVESVASAQGSSVFIGNTYADRERELSLIAQMIDGSVDGLILEPTHARFDQPGSRTWELLHDFPMPLVLVGNDIPGLNASEVLIDDTQGGRLATEHLIAHGHRDIAYLYKEAVSPAYDRRDGYLAALLKAGITPNPDYIRAYSEAEEHQNPGYTYTKWFLGLARRPSAIFYFNDDLALNGIQAIRDAGLSVPEDISVVGFDNIPSSGLAHNRLSTLEHPKSLLGRWAADILFDHIKRGSHKVRRRILVYPELIERSTVGFNK